MLRGIGHVLLSCVYIVKALGTLHKVGLMKIGMTMNSKMVNSRNRNGLGGVKMVVLVMF